MPSQIKHAGLILEMPQIKNKRVNLNKRNLFTQHFLPNVYKYTLMLFLIYYYDNDEMKL